jgi:hypothetical protein
MDVGSRRFVPDFVSPDRTIESEEDHDDCGPEVEPVLRTCNQSTAGCGKSRG